MFLKKDYNAFELQYNKQSVGEVLNQKYVKTTIQILYDKGLLDKYQNTDKVLRDFLFITRRKFDLSEQVNHAIQWFYS